MRRYIFSISTLWLAEQREMLRFDWLMGFPFPSPTFSTTRRLWERRARASLIWVRKGRGGGESCRKAFAPEFGVYPSEGESGREGKETETIDFSQVRCVGVRRSIGQKNNFFYRFNVFEELAPLKNKHRFHPRWHTTTSLSSSNPKKNNDCSDRSDIECQKAWLAISSENVCFRNFV